MLWRQRGADGKVIDWLIDGRSRLDALAKLGLVGPKHPKGRHETPHHYARRPPLTITWPECEEDDQAPFFPSSEEGWFQFHEGLKTDADVYECVLALNVQRRHLNAEQKRDLIVKLLKLQPERSNRWLAAQLKVDHKTLGVVRRDLEATGEIPHFERTVGADGKTRSAKVDKPAVEPVGVVQDKHWYDDETWDWSYRAVAPWVTRTLMETCWSMIGSPSRGTVWDPACGGGHMPEVLAEYFTKVFASNFGRRYDYGQEGLNFLTEPPPWRADWIISRPPFDTAPPFDKDCEDFVLRALAFAREGVAMLVPGSWAMDATERYENLYSKHPPTLMAQIVEAVPLPNTRYADGARCKTYYWVVWRKGHQHESYFFIPPGRRKALSRADDEDRFTASPVIKKIRRSAGPNGYKPSQPTDRAVS